MLTETSIIEENVRIPGQRGALEGILAYPDDRTCCSALIAGPHPLLGGDMRNNVVRSLLKAVASQGAVTLTFNYGGVGESEGGPAVWPAVVSMFWKEGSFPEEHDWVEDTGSAIAELRRLHDIPPIVIGYSFGCWAIVNNLGESSPSAVVLISPNPTQHAFDRLSGCAAPLLLIHCDNDFTCGVSEMIAWFESVREPKTRIQLPAGEHFFRGREAEVTETVMEFLTTI